jgi:GGDEF domain-containing protein
MGRCTGRVPIVPVIARVRGEEHAAVPIGLPADAALPVERLLVRLLSDARACAPRHYATPHGAVRFPRWPIATVVGWRRTQRCNCTDCWPWPALSYAQAQEPRFRDIPVAVIGEAPPDFAEALPNIDQVAANPGRIVARMVPLVRMRAFEARLKRVLKSLDAEGMFDPETGLLTRESFWRDLSEVMVEASDRSMPLSVARFSFDGVADDRTGLDAARLLRRLIRDIDFATREGTILVAFTQTVLRSTHVIARRIAGTLKDTMLTPRRTAEPLTVNVTLATLRAGDTLDTLMMRVVGSRMVAAE